MTRNTNFISYFLTKVKVPVLYERAGPVLRADSKHDWDSLHIAGYVDLCER